MRTIRRKRKMEGPENIHVFKLNRGIHQIPLAMNYRFKIGLPSHASAIAVWYSTYFLRGMFHRDRSFNSLYAHTTSYLRQHEKFCLFCLDLPSYFIKCI